MGVTQYVGARYVPMFADPEDWTKTRTYEPLTIVLHEGNSFTSKQFVPKGIEITNREFWAETGNYNAQVEAYRQEVQRALNLADTVDTLKDTIPVNVLTLGFDNTGTEDNTELFEQYTSEFALYFPAGNYKFDNTIHPINSIYGCGNVRSHNPNPKNVSNLIVKGRSSAITIDTPNDIEIKNLLITAQNSANYCVEVLSTGRIHFYDCSFFTNTLFCIYIAPGSSFRSRAQFIDNCYFRNTNATETVIAIYIGSRNGDNRITNCEIMGYTIGVELGETTTGNPYMVYSSNLHIYCGMPNMPLSRFNQTRGINILGGEFFCTNLYTDTANRHISAENDLSAVEITNHFAFGDNAPASKVSFSCNAVGDGKARILINGGVYTVFQGYKGSLTTLDDYENVITKNVSVKYRDTTPEFSSENYRKFIYSRGFTFSQYNIKTEQASGNQYSPVAKILRIPGIKGVNGNSTLEIIGKNRALDKTVLRTYWRANGTATCYFVEGTANRFYWDYDSDKDCITIYVQENSNSQFTVYNTTPTSGISVIPLSQIQDVVKYDLETPANPQVLA